MNPRLLVAGALSVGALGLAFLAGKSATVPVPSPAPVAEAVPSSPSAAMSGTLPPPASPGAILAVSAPVAEVLHGSEKKSDAVRVLIAAEGESVLAAQMAGRIVNINA